MGGVSLAGRGSSDGGLPDPLSLETHLLPKVDLAAGASRLLHLVRASLLLLLLAVSTAVGGLLAISGLLGLAISGLLGRLAVSGLAAISRLVVRRLAVAKDRAGTMRSRQQP